MIRDRLRTHCGSCFREMGSATLLMGGLFWKSCDSWVNRSSAVRRGLISVSSSSTRKPAVGAVNAFNHTDFRQKGKPPSGRRAVAVERFGSPRLVFSR